MASKKNISIWGAGAEGVTFANLVDPSCSLISYLIDINPNKQGHYIPGTGHQIINYKDIKKYDVDSVILMNQNYFDENGKEIRTLTSSEAGTYMNYYHAIYEHVVFGYSVPSPAEEVVQNMKIIDAALESAKEGRVIGF